MTGALVRLLSAQNGPRMNRHPNAFLAAAVLATAGLLSCAGHPRSAKGNVATSPPGAVNVGRYGTACRGEGVGPVGYRPADIGKWGVPNPTAAQLALLSRIRRYDRSPTLRFAFIERGPYEPQFIVYDNGHDPCALSPLLNGTPIEYYQPQQTPYTFSGPEGGTPYPWSATWRRLRARLGVSQSHRRSSSPTRSRRRARRLRGSRSAC